MAPQTGELQKKKIKGTAPSEGKTRKPISHPRNKSGVHSEMLHVRVEGSLKAAAEQTLKAIGMTMPMAMRLFLHRIVIEKRLPLTLDVPNAETVIAIEEARAGNLRTHRTPEALFDALEASEK